MEKRTKNKYLYIIYFWQNPKSGHDIIRKNMFMNFLKETTLDIFGKDPHLTSSIKEFESRNSGMVINHKIVESDFEIIDAEEEIMPLIRENNPEAKYIRFKLIS